MPAIDLSVIIVNYNVRHFLEQCLHSVQRAMEGIEGEIIVVDNYSQDDSLNMLEASFADRVVLIANRENTGFSKANNQGIARARGRYVLLLNPDTVVSENTFRLCLDFMDAHPKAGALGVHMIDGQGQFLPESKRALPTPWVSFYKIFGLAKLFPRNKRFARYHLSYLDEEEDHEIEILSGAYMWLRQAALEKIGNLDESFFMYGEDIDLSYRMIQGGYQNVYLAKPKIIHYKGESTKKGSLNYVKVFYQAMIIFARKHFGGRRQWMFVAAIRLAVYFRASLAIARRIAQRLAFPLLEAALIYLLMFGIKAYWEHNVKYVVGGTYPDIFTQVYMPVYTLVFVSLLWLLGAYKKPFRLRPLIEAPIWAFFAIATSTYLFDFILNFSRAIVGLSAIFTMLMALATRGFINWREKGSFFFTESPQQAALLLAQPNSLERLLPLLRGKLAYPADLVGLLTPTQSPEQKQAGIDWLGSTDQLPDVLQYYAVKELIFCQESLPGSQIIDLMQQHQGKGIRFKIIPVNADYVVGSQAIYQAAIDRPQAHRLYDPEKRRQKAAFDLVGSIGLLLAFPLLFFLFDHPGAAWRGLWQVLMRRAHLVGFQAADQHPLPPIKPGLLSLIDRVPVDQRRPVKNPGALDRYYARTYSWMLDMEIVMASWRRIGAKAASQVNPS